MLLSFFDYDMPKDRVALWPRGYNPDTGLWDRDASRMMVLHSKSGAIEHRMLSDLPEIFGKGDVMVVNASGQMPCVLKGMKLSTRKSVEITLLRETDSELSMWDAVISPANVARMGNKIVMSGTPLYAECTDNLFDGMRTLRLGMAGKGAVHEEIERAARLLIPDEILSRRKATDDDYDMLVSECRAECRGSIMPSRTGIHISRRLNMRLQINDVSIASVRLDVGIGNNTPLSGVKLGSMMEDYEKWEVAESAADIINSCRKSRGHVCAVGADVLKVLEAASNHDGTIRTAGGTVSKLLYPPPRSKAADCMLTVLGLPKSRDLLAACMVGGEELTITAHEEAVRNEYKFGIYGDLLLIVP